MQVYFDEKAWRPRLSQSKLMILVWPDSHSTGQVLHIFKCVSGAICHLLSHWEPYSCQLRLHSWLVWYYSCRLKTSVMKTRSLCRTCGMISTSVSHFHKQNLQKIQDPSLFIYPSTKIFVGHSDQVLSNTLNMWWTRHTWSFYFFLLTEYIDLNLLVIHFLI